MKNDQQKMSIKLKNRPRWRCIPTHAGVGGPPTLALLPTHAGVGGTAHAGVAILNIPFQGLKGFQVGKSKQWLYQKNTGGE